jgi:N-hydroxyarylamine O-acetyltransferase
MTDTAPAFDLDAYLARIGYSGPRAPTLRVLRALHALHPATIPFENLSALMGQPVPLDLATLQAKLVAGGRGGYCYEHNGVFAAALETLGFAVTRLAARVLWGSEQGDPLRSRSHMLLMVQTQDGPHIADVGFGGNVMTGPLRFEAGPAQGPQHERFRLIAAGPDQYELQGQIAGAWAPFYRFDLWPYLPVDYEPLNWFTASHPSSPFVSNLMAARSQPHRRLALFNTRYTVRPNDAPPVERTLDSMDALKAVLTQDFGLTLPEGIDAIGPRLGLA